jgi:hypothetical protein
LVVRIFLHNHRAFSDGSGVQEKDKHQTTQNKTMKPFQVILMLALLCLVSCEGTGFNVFGKRVEIVSNRNADGTFKPINEVTNSAGESPDTTATLYHYPSGDLGVTGWYGGPLKGKAPKLNR